MVTIYSDAPPLRPGHISAALQVLGWLLHRPTAWRNFVARVDPTLPPHFSLLQLRREHLRHPEMRRLLFVGYIVVPLLVSLLIGLPHVALYKGLLSTEMWGVIGVWSGILGVSGLLSALLGVGGGIVGGPLNVVVGAIVDWSVPSIHSFGIRSVVGIDSPVSGLCAALGGFSLGFATHARLQTPTLIRGTARSIGAVLLGVLIGVAAIFLTVKFGSNIWGGVIGSTGLAIAIGLSLQRRGSSWKRGMVVVVSGCLGYVAIATIVIATLDFFVHRGLTGNLLAGAFLRARETIPALWLMLPAIFGEIVGGATAGAFAGIVGGMGGWLALAIVIDAAPNWPTIPVGIACIVFGFAVPVLRPLLLYPIVSMLNLIIFRLDEKRTDQQQSLLKWNAAFWDEDQRLPLFGLDAHLILVSERNPVDGQQALAFIAKGRQRWAAQEAQLELDARTLERCRDIESMARSHRQFGPGDLAGPASAVLRNLARISQDVAAILEQNVYNQRVSLRALADRVDGLIRELNRSTEPHAIRFARIISEWQEIITQRERTLAEETARRQEIESPYVIGLPLNELQSVFVGRAEVAERIERLLLQPQRPPLLLYGQRRTGKTSLLHNLGRLLPSSLVPLFIDLQGPASRARNEVGFLYNLSIAIAKQAREHRDLRIVPVTREALKQDPFTVFEQWLDSFSEQLGDSKALLLFDEFEQLEEAMLKERLDRQLILGMLRHIIQHKPKFRVLLAGSHQLHEMKFWASYMINVQIVKLDNLTVIDALRLVEHPVQNFALRYQKQAAERVLHLTGCHPYLLQLLCDRIVHLKNAQPLNSRFLATVDDLENAISDAVQHGAFFFSDIENNQLDEQSRVLLRFLAKKGEHGLGTEEECHALWGPDIPFILKNLLARDLLELFDNGFRFRSELVRRWFTINEPLSEGRAG